MVDIFAELEVEEQPRQPVDIFADVAKPEPVTEEFVPTKPGETPESFRLEQLPTGFLYDPDEPPTAPPAYIQEGREPTLEEQEYTRVYETPPEIEEAPESEEGLIMKTIGAGEAALASGTGATTGLVGSMLGTLKGIAKSIQEGKFGTQEGANIAQKESQKFAQTFTYEPRTETGREIVGAIGEVGQALEPLGPMASQLQAVGAVARPAIAARIPKIPRATRKPVTDKIPTQALGEAEARGIPVMTTDVKKPKTFVGKFLQTTGERIPLTGTGAKRAAQQVSRVDAVKNLLKEFGAEDAAKATDDVMSSLLEKRGKDVKKYTSLKRQIIDKAPSDLKVPVERTLKAIDNEIARLKELKKGDAGKVIAELEDWKKAFQDQNLQNVEDLRSLLGESFKGSDLAGVKTLGEKSINKLYGPLKEDMGEFIKNTGDKKDFTKWQVANKRLSGLMGELDKSVLKRTLAKGEATPEIIRSMLFSKKPSDVKALFKNLDAKGKAKAKVALLNEAYEKSLDKFGEVVPDRFITQTKKLGSQFGIFLDKKEKAQLDGLTRALSITKRAGDFAVSPPTGVQLSIPVGTAVLTDLLGGAGAGLATAAGIGGLARLYESGPVRNILIRLSKTKRGSPSETREIMGLLAAIQTGRQEQKPQEEKE